MSIVLRNTTLLEIEGHNNRCEYMESENNLMYFSTFKTPDERVSTTSHFVSFIT